ncbi:MAG: tetratricopeptide repeat protein [Spirochaetes bacterium]|nr:tetratricopeptide repeat protein [Spirochaetota bacterium]
MKNIYIISLLLIILSSCLTNANYENNDIKNLASDNTKTANEFLRRYEYQKALEYFKEALDNNLMVDNLPGVIKNYADIGRVYILINDFDLSLEYFNTALELTSEDKNLEMEKAYVLNGIGEVYYYLKEYKISKKFFKKALKIESSLNNTENQALIMQNIAKIERSKGKYDKALNQFISSARLLEIPFKWGNLENIKNLSLTYYSIGQTYSKLENYSKAIEYIKKALNIDRMIENASGIADDYYALGVLAEKSNMSFNEVLKYFERSRNIYKILDNVNQYVELINKIAAVYYNNNDLKKFYENKRIAFVLTRSDAKKNIANEILEMLKDERAKNIFSEDEILEIKKKYSKKK